MVKTYTDRVEGVQIRECVYPCTPSICFDIVKWDSSQRKSIKCWDSETCNCTELMLPERCYTIGQLKWNPDEKNFDFYSVGSKWFEENPGQDVICMIKQFENTKRKELMS